MMAIDLTNSGLFSLLGKELYKDYFENEQGGAIDNMGGTIGDDASSDVKCAQAHSNIMQHYDYC